MDRRNADVKQYLVDVVQVTVAFLILLFVLCSLENISTHYTHQSGKSLLSQSSKWYKISMQDKDLIYALQHCDYAVAYLNAARHISSDTILEKGSGIDLHKYHNKLILHHINLLKGVQKTQKNKNMTSHASWIT